MRATAEQEQQDSRGPEAEPRSNQGTPRLEDDPPTPTDAVQLRIRRLRNRRLFLLETQGFRKMADDGGTSGEVTSEYPDTVCELQAIEKELEELLREKTENQDQSCAISQQSAHAAVKSARPSGGVYLLPQFHLAEAELTQEPGAATTADQTAAVVPVDGLGQTSAVTQCPSCEKVVLTNTSSSAGEASWTVCYLCSMLGCVLGCCLIPFFMKRLKSVSHQCPQCRALIHTYRPL